eukprot:Hpha_TRINITY_DN15233_c0_g2::TRINITY_DN15233_c0_g2_i1::g.65483::m.65483
MVRPSQLSSATVAEIARGLIACQSHQGSLPQPGRDRRSRRTGTPEFECACGRSFAHVRGLQRHRNRLGTCGVREAGLFKLQKAGVIRPRAGEGCELAPCVIASMDVPSGMAALRQASRQRSALAGGMRRAERGIRGGGASLVASAAAAGRLTLRPVLSASERAGGPLRPEGGSKQITFATCARLLAPRVRGVVF